MKRNYRLHTKFAFKIYNNAKICTKCYAIKNICVHHKNENPGDNRETNLQILCKACHARLHMLGNKINLGKKHTQKTKDKISKSKQGHIPYMKGRKHKEQSIEKMRLSHKGVKHTQKTKDKVSKAHYKKVNQYTINGKLIQTFNSITEAGIGVGLKSDTGISMCCNGKRKRAGGYIWKFKNKKALELTD